MTAWTDERIEKLKQLYADNLSCSQIAYHLGGITRNAVIGKIHRMGLQRCGGVKPPRPKRVEKPRPNCIRYGVVRIAAPRVPDVRPTAESIEAPRSLGLSIIEVRATQCHYPTSADNESFACCGNPVATGPYCAAHAAIVYAPRESRAHRRAA